MADLFKCPKLGYYQIEVYETTTLESLLGKAGYSRKNAELLLKCAKLYWVPKGQGRQYLDDLDLYRPFHKGDILCFPYCLPDRCQAIQNKIDGEARLLIGGNEIFREITKAIFCARDYIYISGWMIDLSTEIELLDGTRDSLGELFKYVLKENPKLTIYILWSQLSSTTFPGNTPANIKEKAISVFGETLLGKRVKIVIGTRHPRFPYLWSKHPVTSESLPSPWDIAMEKLLLDLLHAPMGSIHSKMVIVDGKITFCGSANLIPGSRNPALYREVTAKINGYGATLLNNVFVTMWNHELKKTTGEPPGFYVSTDVLPTVQPTLNSILNSSAVIASCDPELELSTTAIKQKYFQIIKNAKESIYIENQYFRDLDIARALRAWAAADRRNRRVTIVMPNIPEEAADIKNLSLQNLYSFAATILALRCLGGMDSLPYAYERISLPTNIEVLSPASSPYIHSKLIITDWLTDSAVLLLGSSNLNSRGLDGLVDSEVNIYFENAAIAKSAYAALQSQESNLGLRPHNFDLYLGIQQQIKSFRYEQIDLLALT